MFFGPGLNKTIVKFLGPHGPDGLLAFVFLVVASGLIAKGIPPLLVILLVGVLYGIYAYRQTQAERHKERAAEIAVESKETDLRLLREKQAAKLRKDTVKAIQVGKDRSASGSKKP